MPGIRPAKTPPLRRPAKRASSATSRQLPESSIASATGSASPEWLAWQRVMADPQASAKCILDFDRSFPVGGRGKKRGSIDWSEWVHEFRVEHSKSDRSNERKLDWEAFIPAVRAARGWTLERANVEWERLKGDKSVERDMGGYGDFKLRLCGPGTCWPLIAWRMPRARLRPRSSSTAQSAKRPWTRRSSKRRGRSSASVSTRTPWEPNK